MNNTAVEDGLTLAPFRRIYRDKDIALLTDSYFVTQHNRAAVAPADEPSVPKVIPMPDRAHFEAAVQRWFNDIYFDSLPDDMKEHESFTEIVQEGSKVVPLIAAHLRRSPSFLFLALEEIFGEDPVQEDAYGNLDKTVTSWLQWLQR